MPVTAKKIVAKAAQTLSLVPNESLEDSSPDVAADIATRLAAAVEGAVDSAFVSGDGTSTYGGITGLKTAIAGLLGAVTAASGNDTLGEFTVADFNSVIAALPSQFHENATWLAHPTVWSLSMLRLSAAAGLPVSQDGGKAFLGYPVRLSGKMPSGDGTTDFTGLLVAAFGDFQKAVVYGDRRGGVTVARSDQRYVEQDKTAFRASARVDIVWHGLGSATAAGAVVGLIGN